MTYQIIDAIVAKLDPAISAAEVHGIACGMLCLEAQIESSLWITETFQDDVNLLEEDKNILISLFELTRKLMASDDFSFDLLLPEEDDPLTVRVEAIRNWCLGFLFAVGKGVDIQAQSDECGEIIKDIVEFTKLDAEVAGPEDENAFMEIHEYLRAAVMLIREEYTASKETPQTH